MAGATLVADACAFEGHGEMFAFLPNIELMDFSDGASVLGTAKGCFKITW